MNKTIPIFKSITTPILMAWLFMLLCPFTCLAAQSESIIITVTVDGIPPANPTILIDDDETYTNSSEVVLSLGAEDASHMIISQDPDFSDAQWQSFATSMNFGLSSGDGTETVYTKFKDELGNETAAVSDSIILDTAPPTIELEQPTTPTKDDVTLSYTVSDNFSSEANISITGDDSPYTQGQEYSVTLTAADEAGNSAVSNMVNFTIDKSPPTILIEEPTTPTNQDVILSYVVSDNVSSQENITVTGDDSPYTQEGDYSVTLTATDELGHSTTSDPVSFTIDKTAPVIVITSPEDGVLVNTPTITLEGTVDEVEFTEQSVLIEGENTITKTATDEADNDASASITVTLDTIPPEIIITSPVDGAIVETPTITLRGTIDGAPFIEERTLHHTGENLITKTATDLAGNTSQASITVIFDISILTINPIASPTNVDTQIITGTKNVAMEEIAIACPTANIGVVNYPTDTSWECVLTSLAEGENNIVVVGKDGFGNELFQVLATVVLDVTAPTLLSTADVLDKHNVEIAFSEEVTGANLISNYFISPTLGLFVVDYQGDNRYILSFENSFEREMNYGITVNGITDTAGNSLAPGENSATFSTNQIEFLGLIMSMSDSGDFGSSVAYAGDVNGDGFDDVIVGAQYGAHGGRAYIYFGGPSIDDIADVTMIGEFYDDNFGCSVASAGDVNNDGFDDVIIGAFGNDDGGTLAGKAYIYFGGPSMDNVADVTMVGEASEDVFAYSVSSAGDVNNDGFDDVIVGAHWNDDGGNHAGKAYVYFGGSSMDSVADVTMVGEARGDNFGYSVASAGDVNDDDFDDVIVGAPKKKIDGAYEMGKVYIYFGGSSMNDVADVTMVGKNMRDNFGISVASASDINNDGFDDVVIGASYKAFIYFGGAPMNDIADVTMIGEGGRFGSSVAYAGDVNGDGFGDVIIGAYYNHDEPEKAYIYFGGPIIDNVANAVIVGESVGDWFGYSVASAGDLNYDGFGDVICAAWREGKVYIYGIDNINPALLPTATIVDERHVEVVYSERVKRANSIENYSISPSLDITNVIAQGDNVYRLTLESPPALQTEYTITATDIVDLVGNLIDDVHNQAIFIRGESFLPVVDSFLVVDSDSGNDRYTNSRDVRVFMEDRGIDGEVVKWLITESSTQPNSADFLLTERPTDYTIQGGEGWVRLYAWVMDERDNVSVLSSNSQSKIILDTVNPTITSFSVINDRELRIIFSESVKGADFSENYTIDPTLGDISISRISSCQYIIITEDPQILGQVYTLNIANIVDLAGNPLLEEEITFTGQMPSIPTVDSFMATDLDSGSSTHTNSHTVSISMTESDISNNVIKWLIIESPIQPQPSDFTLTQRPATYTIQSGEGAVTLCAWVMDEDNNISIATSNSQHTIILDTTPPFILPNIRLPDEYSIEITYSESVLNANTNRNWSTVGSDEQIFTLEGTVGPTIAIDNENNIHWAWRNYRNGEIEIWYAKTTKDGEILISPHAKFSTFYSPYITINANEEICWAFKSSSNEIYFAKTDKEGNILINAKKIFSGGCSPVIAVDSSGNIHWAWYGGEGHNIYYAKTDDTGSILIDARIQFGGPNFYECSLATDKDGNINFAFRDVDDDIWYAKMDEEGQVLIPHFKIFTTGTTGWFEPSIVVDVTNELCWVWRNNDDNKLWFAKTDVQGNIVEDVKSFEDTPSSNYYNPFIAIDKSNRLYIAWNRDGNIYWNRMLSHGADYTISPSLGNIIVWNKYDNVYNLLTAFSWLSNQYYTLTVDGVTDLAGNPLTPNTVSFSVIPPTIESVTPADGTIFYEGDEILASVSALSSEGGSLEYQFLINGSIVQPWSSLSIYDFGPTNTIFGQKTIKAEVRGSSGAKDGVELDIFICKRPVEPPQR